ncbi:hypothetical protein [Nonomuraea sp. PA05]|nr:hypothetical protein [Nonomuraea sp. PA05]
MSAVLEGRSFTYAFRLLSRKAAIGNGGGIFTPWKPAFDLA